MTDLQLKRWTIRLHVLCGYISKEETPESHTQIRFLHIVIGYIDTELEI